MKKIFSFFAALLFAGSMMAGTVQLTNANIVAAGDGATGYKTWAITDGASRTWNAFAIKNQHSKSTSAYHYLQIKKYASNTASYIQVPNLGETIQSITMTVSSASQPMDGGSSTATLFFSESNTTSAAGEGVASGTGASSVTIDASGLNLTSGYITTSAGVRIWDITITTAAAPAVATPKIIGETSFFDQTSVTITCDTVGAAIYYTLDGTDPTSASTEYTGAAITLTDTTTVKAIAIKGSDVSGIASKTFTKGLSYASLDALVAANLESNTLVKVSFSNAVIDSIYLNSSSKRYGIWVNVMAANEKAVEIYCNKAEIPAAWEVGDKVSGSIIGTWTYYENGAQWEIVPSASDWTWEELTRTPDARMHGAYTIGGENADFATLSAAATALRTRGLKDDVDFVICADIAEVANVGLVNQTDYTVTIRPNAASKRTISFGTVSDNIGPSGHIVIGYDLAGWAATPTKNVVIDGSYEDAGQYLEFLGGTKGGRIVVFYGKVTNSEVRNCRLVHSRTTGTSYVVELRTEQTGAESVSTTPLRDAYKTDNAPDGVGVDNCYMKVTGMSNSQTVYYNGSASSTTAGKPKDCYVRNSELISNLRGVFLYGAINPIIENNTIRINGYGTGMLSHGINGTLVAGTVIVRGNKFEHLESYNSTEGDYGVQGITASGGATVWMIENNYFAGMTASYNTLEGKAVKLLYVRCGDSCVVRHNTFHMPVLAKKPSTALGAANPIACLHLGGSKKYIVKNNIFVSEETVANNSLIRGGLNENCGNNVFFHAGGNCAVNAASPNAMTWDEFTANGANAGSKWTNPVFVDAAAGDLRIKVANNDLKMPLIEDVDKDITGASRYTMTYAGAFEYDPNVTTAVEDVMELNVEGVQKIFRNGEVLIIRDGKTYNMMGQIVE